MSYCKEERNKQQEHLIYGYRERAGKRRWYVGCTLVRRREKRKDAHRKAKVERSKFHRFIRKAYRHGKTFDEVLEYFELETLIGTAQQAEIKEVVYTDLYNALAPTGFVLKAGRYCGVVSEESKRRMSTSHIKRWSCPDRRKEQSISCSGWKQTDKVKKQIGDARRNLSPEKRAKKEAGARATREITKKRKHEANIRAKIEEAKARLKSDWQPTMTGPQQAAYVVIKANREMTEKEVVFEMKRLFGWKSKKAITPLLRASGIEAGTYLPHGRKSYERLERVAIKSDKRTTYKYRPLPVFTRWMIAE